MPIYKIEKLKTGPPIVAERNGKTKWTGQEFYPWKIEEEFSSDEEAISYGKRDVPKDKDGRGMFTVSVIKNEEFVLVDDSDTGQKGRFNCSQ